MPRVLLITNPAAARSDPGVVSIVTAVLGREGFAVDVSGTSGPGHAADLARGAVRDGVDVVAVYGGDGTTTQAASGMLNSEVPMALIPGGTGNILAGNLRLPRDPARAALLIARGVPRAVDLGCMEREGTTRVFAVACGAGYDAALMGSTTTEAKKRWKMAAYVARAAETIVDVRNVPTRIVVDGEVIDTPAACVMVINCPEFVPPFLRFRPGIAIDDGLFDVIILSAEGFADSVGALLQLVSGGGPGEAIRFARGREVTVRMEPVQPVQADGDAAGTTPFTARILPGALRVLVPREA
jgi:diacylglycerol kinase family enzyme